MEVNGHKSSSLDGDSAPDDVKDMTTWQFVFVSEMCREMSAVSTLQILRDCKWNANAAVNCAVQTRYRSGSGSDVVKHFEISLEHMASCYFDYTIHLFDGASNAPIGISLSKSDDCSLCCAHLLVGGKTSSVDKVDADNHRGAAVGAIVDDVLQYPLSLAHIAGIKVKDILLRVNNSILISSFDAGNVFVDDIYDRINAIRNRHVPVVLNFRRILCNSEYSVLPVISAKMQPYIRLSNTGNDRIFTLETCAKSMEDECCSIPDFGNSEASVNYVEDLLCHLHPLVSLFYCQHLMNEAAATKMHILLMSLKEQQVCEWKSLLDQVYCRRNFDSVDVDVRDKLGASASPSRSDTIDVPLLPIQAEESSLHSNVELVPTDSSCEDINGGGPKLDDTSYMSAVLKHKLIDQYESIIGIKASFDAETKGSTSIVEVVRPFLRPAYTVRILSVDKSSKYYNPKDPESGFMMAGIPSKNICYYVIWVLDVKKGSDWIVKRTFEEFVEFRESLIAVREEMKVFEFPAKRIFQMVANTATVINQRMTLLDSFLRSVIRVITTVNPEFLSSIKCRLLLDKFVDAQSRYVPTFVAETRLTRYQWKLMLMSKEQENSTGGATPSSSRMDISVVDTLSGVVERFLRVYIHVVIVQEEITELIKAHSCGNLQPLVFSMEEYANTSKNSESRKRGFAASNVGSESDFGIDVSPFSSKLWEIATFLDNMTGLLYDCLIAECYDIVTQFGQYHTSSARADSCLHERVGVKAEFDENAISYKDMFAPRKCRNRVAKFSGLDVAIIRKHIVDAFAVDREAFCLLRHNGPEVVGGVNAPAGTGVRNFGINLDVGRKYPLGLSVSYEKLETSVHNAIRRQIEYEVLTPLVLSKIREHLKIFYSLQEDRLSSKIAQLRHKPQCYFGIDVVVQSQSQWYDVVKRFKNVWSCSLPCYRISAYLEAIKRISAVRSIERSNSEVAEAGNDGQVSHQKLSPIAIGADDFLPILIYVIVHSKPVHLLALNAEFQLFCGRNSLISETGYYLTAFNAAVLHLLNFDMNDQSIAQEKL